MSGVWQAVSSCHSIDHEAWRATSQPYNTYVRRSFRASVTEENDGQKLSTWVGLEQIRRLGISPNLIAAHTGMNRLVG